MKKVLCLVLVLVLSVFAVSAFADEAPKMTVQGNAQVSVEADTVSLQLGVQTKARNLREAQRENSEKMDAVLKALYACGIEEKDLITNNFNVYSSYDYDDYVSSYESQRMLVYYVDNSLVVTIHDISIAGEVLDAAVEAGANNMYGIVFTSSKANEAYLVALKRAVEDAKIKAETLAEAAGVKLGQLVEIQASPNYSAYRVDSYGITNSVSMDKMEVGAGTSVMGGDLNVDATVTLIYSYE